MPDYSQPPVKGPNFQTPEDAFGPGCNAPTAAGLHRWYCGPWCKECSRFGCPYQPEHQLVPGLHTRCPETWVEGLEYAAREGHWVLLDDRLGGAPLWWPIGDAHAADLLVMGSENDAMRRGYGVHKHRLHDGIYTVKLVKDHQWSFAQAPTLPEAVALAMHRAKDAGEHK